MRKQLLKEKYIKGDITLHTMIPPQSFTQAFNRLMLWISVAGDLFWTYAWVCNMCSLIYRCFYSVGYGFESQKKYGGDKKGIRLICYSIMTVSL